MNEEVKRFVIHSPTILLLKSMRGNERGMSHRLILYFPKGFLLNP
jgi:hypothetical protein